MISPFRWVSTSNSTAPITNLPDAISSGQGVTETRHPFIRLRNQPPPSPTASIVCFPTLHSTDSVLLLPAFFTSTQGITARATTALQQCITFSNNRINGCIKPYPLYAGSTSTAFREYARRIYRFSRRSRILRCPGVTPPQEL